MITATVTTRRASRAMLAAALVTVNFFLSCHNAGNNVDNGADETVETVDSSRAAQSIRHGVDTPETLNR